MDKFEYDIAISFHNKDESLAVQLCDLIGDRFRTFLYTKRQDVVVGTDGEKTLSNVFNKQSRLVVIFYRKEWGETPWTRIEETAIRNRAHDEGYDFTLLIRTDKDSSIPNWFPKTRIYLAFDRYGITGAASVIESKIVELGGSPSDESVSERAARHERQYQFERKVQEFKRSREGLLAVNNEIELLISELEHCIASANKEMTHQMQLKTSQNKYLMVIIGLKKGLRLLWDMDLQDSIENAVLDVSFWNGHPEFPGIMLNNSRKLNSDKYSFELLPNGSYVWVSNDMIEFSTKDFAEHIIKYYLDQNPKKTNQMRIIPLAGI